MQEIRASAFPREEAETRVLGRRIKIDPEEGERAVLAILDHPTRGKFKWRVYAVAASGFFTTSYCIFCTNVISPALNFVYPLQGGHNCDTITRQPFIINITTLAGIATGMLVFGISADQNGRKYIYGLELIIVIIATVGLVQSSAGYHSMDVYGWIGFWRFVLGVGLGAEYPLSATIAAEWSSTKSRGRMLAAVFLMQSVGQATAYWVTIAVLRGLGPRLGLDANTTDEEQARQAVDIIWRVVIGVGAVPALVAILLRRILPESPRWLADREGVEYGVAEARRIYKVPDQTVSHLPESLQGQRHPILPQEPPPHLQQLQPVIGIQDQQQVDGADHVDIQRQQPQHISIQQGQLPPSDPLLQGQVPPEQQTAVRGPPNPQPQPPRRQGIFRNVRNYFVKLFTYLGEKNRWRCLLGVSSTWFLLDLAVYGLGLDSPGTIATMYLSSSPAQQLPCEKSWLSDPSQPDMNIFSALQQDSLQNLQTISTGTLPGSLIIVFAIDYVPRAAWSGWMFVIVAALLAVTGSTLFVAYETDKHAMTVVFYVLVQLLLNLGPNTMTWILPSELFATRYRATLYGFAGAFGKLGAIAIQFALNFGIHGRGELPLSVMLLALSPLMIAGGIITWAWIPEVQLPNRGDEEVDQERESIARSRDDGASNANSEDYATDGDATDGDVTDGDATDASEPAEHASEQSDHVRDDHVRDDHVRDNHVGDVRHRTFLERIILINRTLEDIADDPAGGFRIGFRQKFGHLLPACGPRRQKSQTPEQNEIQMTPLT